MDAKIQEATAPWVLQKAALKAAVDTYIIDHYEPSDGYEDDEWLATKVVAHKRTWNVDKLTKLVPRGILKNVLKVSVDGGKVDEYVRAGKLDRDKIAAAYEETPNEPYVKYTAKKKDDGRATKEAASLAEKLT